MKYAKPAVVEAQIDYVFEQLIANTWPHTIAVLVTSIALWYVSHSLLAFAWLVLILVSHVARLFTMDRLWKQARDLGDYRRIKPLLVMGMLLAGAIWGLVPIWFMNQPDAESVIFISIALAGMCASSLPALAAYHLACLAFVSPVLIMLIAKLFLLGLHATALLGIACLLAFVMISTRINQIITASITIDFQNRELLEQVTVAKEKAEYANRAKSRFLAVASHDLRQPLQALGLILESMKLKFKQTEQQGLIQQGLNCHDALSDMFNSLMDLSRLEANDLNVHLNHVQLDDLLARLLHEFQASAEAKNVTLELHVAPDCVVYTDPLMLGRIIRNLLSNAIKFTEGGSVSVCAREDQDKVAIQVKDTGVGIPLDEQVRVFEEYHQVTMENRARQQGVGLGLSVVKRLSDLLHLDLKLQSIPGEGSTFRFLVAVGDSSQLPDKQQVSGFSLQGCRVLVVDDEPDILTAIGNLLAEWGCEVIKAEGQESAFAALAINASPQIIISDYHLGDCDGPSLIKAVQNHLNLELPALVMSGDTSPDLVQNMRQQALFLLQKPVKPVHLRKVMRQLLHQNAIE